MLASLHYSRSTPRKGKRSERWDSSIFFRLPRDALCTSSETLLRKSLTPMSGIVVNGGSVNSWSASDDVSDDSSDDSCDVAAHDAITYLKSQLKPAAVVIGHFLAGTNDWLIELLRSFEIFSSFRKRRSIWYKETSHRLRKRTEGRAHVYPNKYDRLGEGRETWERKVFQSSSGHAS